MTPEQIALLRPRPFTDPAGEESSEEYRERAVSVLPAFPPDVLKQWLYRHYPSAIHDWGWLGFPGLSFWRATWPTERVLADVDTNRDCVEAWRWHLSEDWHFPSPLLKFMVENGTWPVPILVLDNSSGIIDPYDHPLCHPYHLVEGHHRLSYLRELAARPDKAVVEEHDLWIATADPGMITRTLLEPASGSEEDDEEGEG